MNWTSASDPGLDFRTNGSALPMYGIFAVCLAVFLVGVYRRFREMGFVVDRTSFRSLNRLLDFGLLQRRLLHRRYSAWTHMLLF